MGSAGNIFICLYRYIARLAAIYRLRAFLPVLFLPAQLLIAQSPYVRQFGMNEGLLSNSVYQVFQDSRKFIWFATDAGASQFDGTHFRHYTQAEGLPTAEIMRIEEDSRGRIWLFHLDGRFSYIYKDRLYTARQQPFLDSLSNSLFFRRMHEDQQGTLYFYSNLNREIFVLDTLNRVQKFQLSSSNTFRSDREGPIQGNMIYRLEKSRDGFRLYTGRGIFLAESLSDTLILLDDSFHVDRAFSMKNGDFFLDVFSNAGVRHQLLRFNEAGRADSLYFSYRMPHEIITDVLADRSGNLWLSSYFTGVYIYRNGKLIRRLNISEAQNILQDHEGNIWIASLDKGVSLFHARSLSHYHFSLNDMAGHAPKVLSRRRTGGIWVSDGQQIFTLDQGRVGHAVFFQEGAGFDKMAELENGKLVLMERYRPLQWLEKGRRAVYPDHPVISMAMSYDARRLAAIYPFYLFRFDQQTPAKYSVLQYPERFTSVFYDPGGQLFVGGSSIFRVQADSLIVHESLRPLFGRIIRHHLIIDAYTQLLATSSDSLWLFQSDKLYSINACLEHPLPHQIKTITYHAPWLFLATSRHVFWSRNPHNALKGEKVELNSLDVRFTNIHDLVFSDETLFVASDQGLSSIPVQSITDQRSQIPLPYFRGVVVNEQPLAPDQQQSRLRGKHSLRFSLGSLHYSSDERAVFAYMLQGRDTAWMEPEQDHIVYQDLRPGRYQFVFRTRLPNSPWSPELSHEIIVRPTLRQHPLFFGFWFLVAFGLIYATIIREKNKAIRRQANANQMLLLEQKALMSMMNPHFIFNALGSIQSYILKNNVADAGLYLSKFARLIRQNLQSVERSLISIEEEVSRLRNYMELECLRLNNSFDFEIVVDDTLDEEALIPAMVLQPIVENAIWHGLSSVHRGGKIEIRFKQIDDKKLLMVVADNGLGMEQTVRMVKNKDSHLHMGMALTEKRLGLIGKKMKVETSIRFSEANPGESQPGTRVEIIVPYVLDAAQFEKN